MAADHPLPPGPPPLSSRTDFSPTHVASSASDPRLSTGECQHGSTHKVYADLKFGMVSNYSYIHLPIPRSQYTPIHSLLESSCMCGWSDVAESGWMVIWGCARAGVTNYLQANENQLSCKVEQSLKQRLPQTYHGVG